VASKRCRLRGASRGFRIRLRLGARPGGACGSWDPRRASFRIESRSFSRATDRYVVRPRADRTGRAVAIPGLPSFEPSHHGSAAPRFDWPAGSPGGFFRVLAPIIPIRPLPYQCRAEAVRQRNIADQVRSSDPVVPIANDAGRAPCAARAPLTRTEIGRRTFLLLQLIRDCCIRKDAERTKGENRQEAKHGHILLKGIG
jgi:hypothetical protein